MGKIFRKINYIGITAIVLYLLSAFVLMELNPFYWPIAARLIYAVLIGILIFLFVITDEP